ncbi:MAG: DNA double-strand break repair nuclease NurA [Candidatus Hodarchaeota archaeon]
MATKTEDDSDFLGERTNPQDFLKKKIELISKAIIDIEQDKSKFMAVFHELKESLSIPEDLKKHHLLFGDKLHEKLDLFPLSGMKIGAVDGSILRESTLGVDLIASKSRGVVFRFFKKKPPDVKYYPLKKDENFNLFGIFQGLNTQELEMYSSVERILAELELVYEILRDETDLDMMIIDGSLYIPEIMNGHCENYYIKKYIERITKVLINIIKICKYKDILLVGVVKDSIKRDLMHIIGKMIPNMMKNDPTFKKFLEFDYRKVIKIFKDHDFFFRYLDEGERTIVLKSYPKNGNFTHHVPLETYFKINELGIFSFLLKPVPMDIPLKVEFITSNDSSTILKYGRRIASLLYPMSKIMINYSEPSPQMEAHKRVKIPEQEFKIIVEMIRRKTGYCPTLLQKRRERKPF